MIFIFVLSSISIVPGVRLPIPFLAGVPMSSLAAVQKIVGPVYGTINHSVGDMYSTETVVPTYSMHIAFALPPLKVISVEYYISLPIFIAGRTKKGRGWEESGAINWILNDSAIKALGF